MPRQSYAAMISTADDRIGQIIKKLNDLDLENNTIIVFMSDNGHSTEPDRRNSYDELYGAHWGGGYTGKWRGAKADFLEGGIRVPAIMSFPGYIPQGQLRDQVIMNADFFTTILDICEIPLPDRKIDGKSLLNVLKSAKAPSPHKVLYWQWQNTWAVREGNWKLIVNGTDRTGKYSSLPKRADTIPDSGVPLPPVFLGNLAEDSPEWKNHAADQPKIVERLTKLHNKWAIDVGLELAN